MSLKLMPLVLVLVVPLLAGAQGPHGPGGGRGKPPSSLELLLKNPQELALTAEQVAQLEALQAALEQKNAPIVEQLEALRPPRPSGPPPSDTERMNRPPPDFEAMRERMQQLEPLITELRANDAAFYQEAEKLLSDSQKARAQELITQEREEHQRRHEAMRQRMQNRQ
ncbi:Spy/CpxP family protein refolding chaperone [Hyalangium rubrum]|uniref:Spy/CpxP family protein refolding chaperone n=1 Tax=Hyalangium rubrum TaxID=3103134 RepID=A0ABU5HAI0_9BACT|nr:Spy/CpxP family protein refolding chaperone [Hyalangium sp. s54d21]MDY7230094.1 Spy/CpxP family protein refolding chaperone [Hyalangium sp. s54d21]